MLLVCSVIFAIIMVLLFARDAPAGQWLDQFIIQGIITNLGKITRGHWISAGALLLAIGVLYWLARADGLLLFSMATPDLAMWFTTFEISSYIDAFVAITIASSAVRLKGFEIHLNMKCLKSFTRFRKNRKREPQSSRVDTANSENDDDGSRFGCVA